MSSLTETAAANALALVLLAAAPAQSAPNNAAIQILRAEANAEGCSIEPFLVSPSNRRA
jgi:hypothetical protein